MQECCPMDYQDLLRAGGAELGVPEEEVVQFSDRLLRYQIRAGGRPKGVGADGEPKGVLVGRRGGLPELPVGMPWPSLAEPSYPAGAPLPFMLSLDCAALPRVPGLPLPADGSLLFFLEPQGAQECGTMSIEREQTCAQVVYVPAGTPTEMAQQPPVDEYAAETFLSAERDLYASVQADLYVSPDEITSDFERHLIHDLPHFAALCALAQRLHPSRPGDRNAVRIGGYTMSAQDSPEMLMADELAAGEPNPDPFFDSEEAEYEVVREWVPLAQFAAPHHEFHFARFLIRHDDLAAGRFGAALSFCEFTE